jgi:hypothetical protein
MEGEGGEFAEVQVAETLLATNFECSTYVVCLTCHSEFSELEKVLLQVRQTAYVEHSKFVASSVSAACTSANSPPSPSILQALP